MSDLIDRQAAIDAIEWHIRTAEEPYVLTRTDEIMNHAFEIAANCVYNLPSAQPERKNGKWLTGTYNSAGDIRAMTVKCSCCGKESVSLFSTDGLLWNIEMIYNFCPYCGADMRERRDDVEAHK